MPPTPSHEGALRVWSEVCNTTGKEVVALVLPIDGGVCATAFQPTEEQSLEDWMEESIHVLIDNGAIKEECPWGALIAPSFHGTPVTDAEADSMEHGDLQARYIEGDESVREIVLVIIMEMDKPPYGQSFSQPLLEPLDEPGVMAPGPMTLSLMSVLMHAAFPEDFKDA
jgi:hypothetical protein